MFIITLDELRSLSKEQISILKEDADKGDVLSQCKLSLYLLFHQVPQESKSFLLHYLNAAADRSESLANLLLGYIHEHAIGVPKNYSKAVESYSKAYDGIILTDNSSINNFLDIRHKRGAEECYKALINQIDRLITTKGLCSYKNREFVFDWTKGVRDVVAESLPSLNQAISNLNALSLESSEEDYPGRWEYRIQDKLYMPIEILKAVAARDYLEKYLTDCGYAILPQDRYFNNALGRCLIDDDDAYDNDYIIGGILLFAGHDSSSIWQYRAGLWYEHNDESLDSNAAAYWYEKAQKDMPSATDALKRVKGSVQFNILKNEKIGGVEDCQLLLDRTSKNRHGSITWLIEGACRGDESAVLRLEQQQIPSKGKTSIFGSPLSASEKPFYEMLEEEKEADKKIVAQYLKKMESGVAKFKENAEHKNSPKQGITSLKKSETEIEQPKKSVSKENKSTLSFRSLEKKYQDLTEKWQKKGLAKSGDAFKQLKAAESKFKASMAGVKQEWWHKLFFEYTYKVDDCLRRETRDVQEKVKTFDDKSSEIKTMSDKLSKLLYGEEKWTETSVDKKASKVKKMLKEYSSAIEDGLYCLDRVMEQTERLRDGRMKRLAVPEFSWSKTLFVIFLVWAIMSLVCVLAISSGYGSLLFSFGSLGALLMVVNNKATFKNIGVGFLIGTGASLVVMLVVAFLKLIF